MVDVDDSSHLSARTHSPRQSAWSEVSGHPGAQSEFIKWTGWANYRKGIGHDDSTINISVFIIIIIISEAKLNSYTMGRHWQIGERRARVRCSRSVWCRWDEWRRRCTTRCDVPAGCDAQSPATPQTHARYINNNNNNNNNNPFTGSLPRTTWMKWAGTRRNIQSLVACLCIYYTTSLITLIASCSLHICPVSQSFSLTSLWVFFGLRLGLTPSTL